MRIATIYWNPNSDETKIKLSDAFDTLGFITKADVMRDVIFDSTEKYKVILEQWGEDDERSRESSIAVRKDATA